MVKYLVRQAAERRGLPYAYNCSGEGWIVQDATGRGHYNSDPLNSPINKEIETTNPGCAIIMYGTNDLKITNDTAKYRLEYKILLDTIINKGVIPIISTIPEFTSNIPDYTGYGVRVSMYNYVIMSLAEEYQIPLIDYNWAMRNLPGFGLSEDGIHPSCGTNEQGYVDGCDFTHGGTKGGYNMRGYTAIQMLEKVKRIIIDDGEADPAPIHTRVKEIKNKSFQQENIQKVFYHHLNGRLIATYHYRCFPTGIIEGQDFLHQKLLINKRGVLVKTVVLKSGKVQRYLHPVISHN